MNYPLLKSDRLSLRRVGPSDIASLVRNANNRQVSRFMPKLSFPYTIDNAKKWLREANRQRRRNLSYDFGIELSESGVIIGVMSLQNINFKDSNAEVGFWIGKRYWKKGLAREALELVLGFSFGELKLHRVYAVVHSQNAASIRLLERSGFTHEGTWREGCYLGHRWNDVYAYGILAREWRRR